MPKKIELDVDKIIATNPKINRETLLKGTELVKNLERTGIVKRSTYSLETPDNRRLAKYSYEEGEIRRGETVRLKRR